MPQSLSGWHEQMIRTVSAIFQEALVQGMDVSQQELFSLDAWQQEQLEIYYHGNRASIMVGLIKDAGQRIGVSFPGLKIEPLPERTTDQLEVTQVDLKRLLKPGGEVKDEP